MPIKSPYSSYLSTLFRPQRSPYQTCMSPISSVVVQSPEPVAGHQRLTRSSAPVQSPGSLIFRYPQVPPLFSPHITPEVHKTFNLKKLVKGSVRLIASGGQGSIYFSLWSDAKSKPKVCIIKIIRPNKDFSTEKTIEFQAQEDLFLGEERSSRNYVLPHYAIYERERPFGRDKEPYAVFPFCENFLNKQEKMFHEFQKTPLIFSFLAMQLLKNTLSALNFMHEKNHIHGDISPSNIGVYKGTWLLIDTDCSTKIDSTAVPAGHYLFKHPAAFVNCEQARMPFNDIYALGMVLKNLLQVDYLQNLLQQNEIHYCREIQAKREAFLASNQKAPSLDSIKKELITAPFSALKNLADLMTCLDETQIPSAEKLLELISERPEALLTSHTEVREAYAKFFEEQAALRLEQLEEYFKQLRTQESIAKAIDSTETATLRASPK